MILGFISWTKSRSCFSFWMKLQFLKNIGFLLILVLSAGLLGLLGGFCWGLFWEFGEFPVYSPFSKIGHFIHISWKAESIWPRGERRKGYWIKGVIKLDVLSFYTMSSGALPYCFRLFFGAECIRFSLSDWGNIIGDIIVFGRKFFTGHFIERRFFISICPSTDLDIILRISESANTTSFKASMLFRKPGITNFLMSKNYP